MANFFSTLQSYIKKEKLMSISNLFVMSITFVLLGMLLYLIVISQTALKYLEEQAQITIFFKDEYTNDQILTYKSKLESDERILEVKFVSKEDALRIFKEINKDEPILLESISASILPASLEVKTKNISDLKSLSNEFGSAEGVEEVRFFEDVITRFKLWSTIAYVVGFFLVAVFLVISYSVVIAMLRTSINSRGKELEIMKLVGASDSYVKSPFIYQGVFFSMIASSIASVFVIAIGIIFQNGMFSRGLSLGFIPGLFINPIIFSLILSFILLLSGFALGYFGSTTAIKRYLEY